MAGAGAGAGDAVGPVVIQIVTTRWTKASRGQPKAAARAAVPEVLPFRAPSGDLVLVETVVADEARRFELVRTPELADGLPLRLANVQIEVVDEAVRVTRRREIGSGWPNRPRDVMAFSLAAGAWGQVVTNHRHSSYSGWSYDKIVVNVARPAAGAADAFAGDPARRLDEQEPLF
jgi:hypothetical protein